MQTISLILAEIGIMGIILGIFAFYQIKRLSSELNQLKEEIDIMVGKNRTTC